MNTDADTINNWFCEIDWNDPPDQKIICAVGDLVARVEWHQKRYDVKTFEDFKEMLKDRDHGPPDLAEIAEGLVK